jgi:hypothetical protein
MSIVTSKQPSYYINDSTTNVLQVDKGRGEVLYPICVIIELLVTFEEAKRDHIFKSSL